MLLAQVRTRAAAPPRASPGRHERGDGGQHDHHKARGSRSRLAMLLLLLFLLGGLLLLLLLYANAPMKLSNAAALEVEVGGVDDDANAQGLPAITQQAFFDIAVNGEAVGRVVVGVFGAVVPKTAHNFIALASGELGAAMSYKGMRFHRIIPGFIVQGGDFLRGDGTGSVSIYGGQFEDEPAGLQLQHDRKYLVQMANAGPDTNGSQFCFMLGAAPHLNTKHVVFGRVLRGFHVIDQIGLLGADEKPTADVTVVDCGLLQPRA